LRFGWIAFALVVSAATAHSEPRVPTAPNAEPLRTARLNPGAVPKGHKVADRPAADGDDLRASLPARRESAASLGVNSYVDVPCDVFLPSKAVPSVGMGTVTVHTGIV